MGKVQVRRDLQKQFEEWVAAGEKTQQRGRKRKTENDNPENLTKLGQSAVTTLRNSNRDCFCNSLDTRCVIMLYTGAPLLYGIHS